MKWISQTTERDCGPASVAILCSVPIAEVYAYIAKKEKSSQSTSSGILLDAIRHFGRTPTDRRCARIGDRKLVELQHDALLGCLALTPAKNEPVKRRNRRIWVGSGHWAVWDAERKTILDPYRNECPLYVEKLVEVI